MPDDFWVNEDVNGIRLDVFPIGPPAENEHPDHYRNAIGLGIETVDRYGRVVQRTSLHLSPYRAKQIIERIHLALDAVRTALPR